MSKGQKFDQDKPRWDLLQWDEVESVVRVLSNGSKKYADDNWKLVPEPRRRYFAAMLRHITAWLRGEKYDKEDNEHHLAHAICCALFLMWFDNKERSNYVCRSEKRRAGQV